MNSKQAPRATYQRHQAEVEAGAPPYEFYQLLEGAPNPFTAITSHLRRYWLRYLFAVAAIGAILQMIYD